MAKGPLWAISYRQGSDSLPLPNDSRKSRGSCGAREETGVNSLCFSVLSHGRLLLIEIKSCGSWVDGVAGLDLVLSLLHLRDYSSPYVLFCGPTAMENSLGFVFLIRPRRVFRDGRLVACWSSWFLTLRSFLCLFRPVLRLAESRSGH